MPGRPVLALVGALMCMMFAGVGWAQTYTMPANDNYRSGSYRYVYGMYYYSCGIKTVEFGGFSYDSASENNTYFNYGSDIQTSWDYTQEGAGAIPSGTSNFELKMTHLSRSFSSSYSYFFNSVWIDWDRDGTFNNIECIIDPADGWNGGERYYPPHRNSYDTVNYGYYSWTYAPFCLSSSSNRGPVTYDIAVPPGLSVSDYRIRCRSWNEYYYKWYNDVYRYRRTRFVEAPYMTSTSPNDNAYASYYSSLDSETEDYTLTIYEPLELGALSVANLWAGSNLPEYTASASGGVGSYTFSLTDNSSANTGGWVQIDSASGAITGGAPGTAGGDVIDLTLTVTDDSGNTDSTNLVFTVLAPIDYPHSSDFDDPANRPYFAIQGGESSSGFLAGQGNNASVGFVVESTSNAGWQVIPTVADDPAQWLGATALDRMSGQEVFFYASGVTLGQISFTYLIENSSNASNAANVGMVISEDGGATWRAVGGPNATGSSNKVYRGDTAGEFIEEEIRFSLSGNQNTLGIRFLGLVRNDSSLTKVVIDDFDFHVPLTLQNSFLPSGQQEVPYGPYELTAIGGLGTTVSFAEDANNPLPAGLEIAESNGSWYIQGVPGTPAQGFEESFGITVTDDVGGSHTLQYTIALTAPPADLTIDTGTNLPTTALGVTTNWQLEALGGFEPLNWSIVTGPSWIDINEETGVLSGTPTAESGPVTVRVQVRDSATREQYRDLATRDFVIAFTDKIQIDPTVFPNLPVIQLPNGEAAASYNQGIPLIGGTAPYAWSLAEGSGLPQGMVLGEFNGFPFLTGTPFNGASGSYAFDLVVSDSASYLSTDPEYVEGVNTVGSQRLTLSFRINIGLATSESLIITTEQSNLPASLFEGESFELYVTAAGGRPPYSFAGTGVGLPEFVTLSENGRMVIAPKAGDGGNYLMSFEVTDVASGRNVSTYQLSIGAPYNEPVITTAAAMPDAFISGNYGLTFRVAGGNPPYEWTLLGGTDSNEDGLYEGGGLPVGLLFNSEAAHLSGIVKVSNSVGATQIQVRVVDAEGFTAEKTFDLAIEPQELPFLEISTTNLDAARLTERYGYSLESTGGYGSHTWTLKPGSSPLPRGLSLTEYGVITGTPQIAYVDTPAQFTLQVRDEAGALVEKAFSLTVNDVEAAQISGPTTPPVEAGVVGAGGGCSMGSSGSSGWLILIFAGLLGFAVQRRRQEG